MKRLQRWTLGICSGVSETLSELENHESVTFAALSDMRRSLARAQSRASSLQRHNDEFMSQARRAKDESQKWRQRARLENEEGPAVECLRRARSAENKAQILQKRAEEGRAQVDAVQAQVRKEEARYAELKTKHRLLQARQAAASASSACQENLGRGERVDDVFERWELKIAEQQYEPTCLADDFSFHALSDEYERREEAEELARSWRAMKGESSVDEVYVETDGSAEVDRG